jgi:hypothetical protein
MQVAAEHAPPQVTLEAPFAAVAGTFSAVSRLQRGDGRLHSSMTLTRAVKRDAGLLRLLGARFEQAGPSDDLGRRR